MTTVVLPCNCCVSDDGQFARIDIFLCRLGSFVPEPCGILIKQLNNGPRVGVCMTEFRQASGWQQRHTLVLASFVALFIAYLDWVNIAVAGIAMQESLGYLRRRRGLCCLFSPVTWRRRFSAGSWRTSTAAKRCWWPRWWPSLFTILTPLAGSASFAALILVRIGLGLGEAPLSPAVLSLFGKWIPETERSRSVAVYSSAAIAGTLVALVVTGLLVASYGWQIVFYAFGWTGVRGLPAARAL